MWKAWITEVRDWGLKGWDGAECGRDWGEIVRRCGKAGPDGSCERESTGFPQSYRQMLIMRGPAPDPGGWSGAGLDEDEKERPTGGGLSVLERGRSGRRGFWASGPTAESRCGGV